MQPYTDLNNRIHITANTATNKDKKQATSFREKTKNKKQDEAQSSDKNSPNKKGFWLGEERRQGQDRRTKRNNRFKRFEHRFQQDRRKKENITITV